MKVKFVSGFQGRETNNVWYDAGQVVEVDDEMAEVLLSSERVTAVIDEVDPVLVPEPETPKPVKRGKK